MRIGKEHGSDKKKATVCFFLHFKKKEKKLYFCIMKNPKKIIIKAIAYISSISVTIGVAIFLSVF